MNELNDLGVKVGDKLLDSGGTTWIVTSVRAPSMWVENRYAGTVVYNEDIEKGYYKITDNQIIN